MKPKTIEQAAEQLNTAVRNYVEARERWNEAAVNFQAVREKIMALGVDPENLKAEIALLEEELKAELGAEFVGLFT